MRGDPPRSAARMHALMLLAAVATGASAAFTWTTTQQWSAVGHPPVAESSDVALVAVEPAPPPGPRPERIDIPAIQVSADLEELHRRFDGELSTPTEWADAGWYAEGIVPGQRGPAVIVGHVDSVADGPAVFYRLPLLRVGDEVVVGSTDGGSQRFVVDGTQTFAKSDFPTQLVYGPTARPELRLITCTGDFDSAAHSYTDNLVVTAHAE
jgi:sortase (surface protein transpeptidase)